ncbi:DUF6887 family protein [Nostoc sp.]
MPRAQLRQYILDHREDDRVDLQFRG